MKTTRAFSLLELLVVISIVAIMMVLSGPMIVSLVHSQSEDVAITDLSAALEEARAYAMANNTYVRVGFGEVSKPGLGPQLVVLSVSSVDGTLSAATPSDLASTQKWPAAGLPLVLSNFNVNNGLGDTSDTTPDATDFPAFSRSVGKLGMISFNGCIQFGPSGGARVDSALPSRFIKIGVDRPAPLAGKNPFVVRMAGLAGTIMGLRKESL